MAAIKAVLTLLTLIFALLCWWVDSDEPADTSFTSEASVSDYSEPDTSELPVAVPPEEVGSTDGSVTVMVYLNGSDLESDSGQATTDLAEMLEAVDGKNVNVVVETLGTYEWMDYNISGDCTQRYSIEDNTLKLVQDNMGQLDCTDPATLSDFISWSAEHYPAERYMLILWDHGSGPVYGFGYDQWQDYEDALTLDEMQCALEDNAAIHFDFIGMDCCIMSSLEVCCALAPYCDYTILSEDFESGLGWAYTDWLTALEADPTMSAAELGAQIVDDMVADNDLDGDSATLAVIDESSVPLLYGAWVDFAYANEDALLENNFSRQVTGSDRAKKLFSDWIETDDPTLSDYYITDIMALASTIDSEESAALSSALNSTISYYGCTEDETMLTGICVTLPYGDESFYHQLSEIFTNCGFDSTYVDWLGKFVDADGSSDFYDYDEFENDWNGWEAYEDDFDWESWLEDGDWSDFDFGSWADEIQQYYDTYYDEYSQASSHSHGNDEFGGHDGSFIE